MIELGNKYSLVSVA